MGEVPTNHSGTDGGINGCTTRITPPSTAHIHLADGQTHARMGCVEANCHGTPLGADAPPFQFAGTVVKPGGTIASAGVTIRVQAAVGAPAIGVTDSAGNFNIPAGTLPNPFPATTTVTACPTAPASMVASVVVGGGDCNGGGTCHGGTQGPITLADR